ncbi:MAG: protocatechuate 3,4-dioxygenase subunit alpha [Pseudomonadota bacterium]
MTRRKETPSQTAGPYVHIGCAPSAAGLAGPYGDLGAGIASDDLPNSITLDIRILDGEAALVTDALVEIWQACPDRGKDPAGEVRCWGRAFTAFDSGQAIFQTSKPRSIAGQAPHFLVWIVARGINLGLVTRIYFPDELEANATDPVLKLASMRAATLIADKSNEGYRHTINLQGGDETVFFDV